jgi:DNA polymerase III epsilon subunit-like protein
MIIFDTETTDLVRAVDTPLDKQPKIIELFALKICDETLEPLCELDLLIDPQEPITEEITKITSITDDMVRGKGAFALHAKAIAEFWLGEKWSCGHNIRFDVDMLLAELKRLGLQHKFPWTMNQLCTVEASEHYEGRRLKLIDLHKRLTGEGFDDAHRAKADVMATYTCVKLMNELGDIPELV